MSKIKIYRSHRKVPMSENILHLEAHKWHTLSKRLDIPKTSERTSILARIKRFIKEVYEA